MPRPLKELNELSKEDRKIYDHACSAINEWLGRNFEGQWALSIDIDLEEMPPPHLKAMIEEVYRKEGWPTVNVVKSGSRIYLELEDPARW